MGRFVVDSDAIGGAQAMVHGTIARLQADVQAMHSQLQALQDSWQGGASSAFQSVVQDWRGTQARVEESLASINVALQSAGRQYADVEAANMRMFAG